MSISCRNGQITRTNWYHLRYYNIEFRRIMVQEYCRRWSCFLYLRRDRNIKSVLWKPTPWNGIPFFIDACNHLRVACSAASKEDFFPSSFLLLRLLCCCFGRLSLSSVGVHAEDTSSSTQAALAFVFWPGNDFSPLDRWKMSSFQCLHPRLLRLLFLSSDAAQRPSQIETSMILQSLQPPEKPAFYITSLFSFCIRNFLW